MRVVLIRGVDNRIGRASAGAGVALSLVLVAGCAQSSSRRTDFSSEARTGVSTSPRVITDGAPVPKGGGVAKIGPPYQVAGRWYVPRHEPGYLRRGVGSWYGRDFHGRRTANGEVFDMGALSAAHPTLPLPSYAYVTNLHNGRTILVRINDRGPYVHDRLIDLSQRAADVLGYRLFGTAQVEVRYAGPAPLDGDDRRERAFLAGQSWQAGSQMAAAPSIPPPGRTWPRGLPPSGLGFGAAGMAVGADSPPTWATEALSHPADR